MNLSTPHSVSVQAELNKGNNVLYWRTTAYSLQSSAVKPVLLRNIQISGKISMQQASTFSFPPSIPCFC